LSGSLHRSKAGILSPEDFAKGLDYMTKLDLIEPGKTTVELYNWGDIFLHPKFDEILKVVADRGFNFGMSTNGSTQKDIPESAIPKLSTLRFSMPGFSQASYDKIHGFRFEEICGNIKSITKQIRTVSREPKISIAFHYYKFNMHELPLCEKFCKDLDIWFHHFYAYFCGISMALDYYGKKLTECDLFLPKFDEIAKRRPKDYACPQLSVLVLDEFSNVLQCCGTDRLLVSHVIGNLYDVDFTKLDDIRKNRQVCKACKQYAIDYIGHNLIG
jgi:MoaA/NifB/PqqE/SkfB family radical SAM enzyme